MHVCECVFMKACTYQANSSIIQSKNLSSQDWDLDSIPGFATNEFCDYLKIADTNMFFIRLTVLIVIFKF